MVGNKPRYLIATLALTIMALAAAGSARADHPEDAYAKVNAALVDGHVLPRYQRLVEAMDGLAASARMYCKGINDAALEHVRVGFHTAMDAWMGVEHLRFGPSELFMRNYRLYFWPQGRGRVADAVDELLAEEETRTLAPEDFRNANVTVQGLPALEYLLYGGDPQAAPPTTDGYCTLLKAITANMAAMAASIVVDWRSGEEAFRKTVTEPGPENVYYRSHQDATLAFFKALYGGMQRIADAKLKPVLGESAGMVRPQAAESPYSGRALANIVHNLEALRVLYFGENNTEGLGTLVRNHARDDELDSLLRRAFDMTLDAARSIDRPLAEAAADPAARAGVELLHTRVLALKQIVRTRLAKALDLTVGFNALDGD